MRLKNLFFILSLLANFQEILYAMDQNEDKGRLHPEDTETPHPSTQESSNIKYDLYSKFYDNKENLSNSRHDPRKISAIYNTSASPEKFENSRKENETLIELCNAEINIAHEKYSILEMKHSENDLITTIEIKNRFLKKYLPAIRQENRVEEKKKKRNEFIETNNAIAIAKLSTELDELSTKFEDDKYLTVQDKTEKFVEKRFFNKENPQFGSIAIEPIDNSIISQIRNRIPSLSTIFLGHPWERIKNIYRKPVKPFSTLEYIKSFLRTPPQINEKADIKINFFWNKENDPFKIEAEEILNLFLKNYRPNGIKNCTKLTIKESDNLATSESVFKADRIIHDSENPGEYTLELDRTINYSTKAKLETRIKIALHNIENDPEYYAWKNFMLKKTALGILYGSLAASLIYGSFHPEANAQPTTTQYIATASGGIVGLLAGFLLGNKHKKTEAQKEVECYQNIVDQDECYGDIEKFASLERELSYNERIEHNDGQIIARIKEYGIRSNPHSKQVINLRKQFQDKGYPRYKLAEE